MKLIPRKQIDIKKWNQLVEHDVDSSIYCQSIFLDKLASHWDLLVNDDYTLGIPIPFVQHLGIKGIYTPNFIRTIDFVGNRDLITPELVSEIVILLKKKFSYCELKMESKIFSSMKEEYLYQELSARSELHTQAKRKLKKFQQSGLVMQNCDVNDVLGVITGELFDKVEYLKLIDFERFEKLIKALNPKNLWVISTTEQQDVLGGMMFYKWKNRLHYIKGGAIKEAKNKGAMYAMMNFAIDYTVNNNLILDFGGSNVKGVQQFNNSFGAYDVHYSSFSWNNAPFWFVFLRKLKKMI